MGFSWMSIPLVGYTFHMAAAEKYHFGCCVYVADRAKEGSGRIWQEWAEGSRNNPVREANASRSAGSASLGKPCLCRGLLISAQHLFTVSWPCCTVSKLSIFPWGVKRIIKFLNACWALHTGLLLPSSPPLHPCEKKQRLFFPLVNEWTLCLWNAACKQRENSRILF